MSAKKGSFYRTFENGDSRICRMAGAFRFYRETDVSSKFD